MLVCCHSVMLVCCHSVMLVCCHAVMLVCCHAVILSCCLCQMLNVTHWDMLNNFCHLPWLKVIFHRYEVTFLYVKCLILILGTWQATFVFMCRVQINCFLYYDAVKCLMLILGHAEQL